MAETAVAGIGDRSLREIAAGAGTSHRMLLYHFGSREGLLAAIVAVIEAEARAAMLELAAEVDSPRALMLGFWERVRRPEALPAARLFFAVFGLTAQRRGAGAAQHGSLTSSWLATAEQAATGLGVPFDAAGTLAGIAILRGLLLELVAGADPVLVDTAYRRFVDLAFPYD